MWDEEESTWITPSSAAGDCLESVVTFAVRAIKPSLANGYDPIDWDDPISNDWDAVEPGYGDNFNFLNDQ